MQESDKRRFKNLLCELMAAAGQELTVPAIEGWWKLLSSHDWSDIEPAMYAAFAGTKYRPMPAMVIEKLPDRSGHMNPEEAWARVPKSEFDGDWISDEMAYALGVAMNLIDIGDNVGARMAFLESYRDQVSKSKMAGRAAKYFYSGSSAGTFEQRERLKLSKTIAAAEIGLIPKSCVDDLRLTQQPPDPKNLVYIKTRLNEMRQKLQNLQR